MKLPAAAAAVLLALLGASSAARCQTPGISAPGGVAAGTITGGTFNLQGLSEAQRQEIQERFDRIERGSRDELSTTARVLGGQLEASGAARAKAEAQAERLAAELNISRGAAVPAPRRLGQKEVPAEQAMQRLQEAVLQYQATFARLEALQGARSPAVRAFREKARAALRGWPLRRSRPAVPRGRRCRDRGGAERARAARRGRARGAGTAGGSGGRPRHAGRPGAHPARLPERRPGTSRRPPRFCPKASSTSATGGWCARPMRTSATARSVASDAHCWRRWSGTTSSWPYGRGNARRSNGPRPRTTSASRSGRSAGEATTRHCRRPSPPTAPRSRSAPATARRSTGP